MAYSTIESVLKKINQVTLFQLLNDEGRLDSEIDLGNSNDLIVIRFSQAADDAAEEIDPYLRHRYTLPFSSVPKLIINVSDDITIYNIYKRRNRESMPDSIQSQKKNTDSLLIKIMKGELDLGVTEEPQSLKNEISTNKTSSDRIFNKDLWTKF